MKSLCAAIVFGISGLIVSSAAQAWPAIGDVVKYDLSVAASGKVKKGMVVITTEGIDPVHDVIQQNVRFAFPGKVSSQRKSKKLSEVQALARWSATLSTTCRHYHGVPERIATPAGVFSACRLVSNDPGHTGFIWMANITNGLIKSVSRDNRSGHVTSALLNSFSNGR